MMKRRLDPRAKLVYGRLWGYVNPHKLVGLIAVISMAATAVVELSLIHI